MRKAIYPGTFDPITYGHIDIIRRAASLFDELVVAVSDHREKNPLFTLQERADMARRSVLGMANVSVVTFDVVLVEFAQRAGAQVVVRGLRAVSDFEYEFQMALMNKELNPGLETVFIMSAAAYSFVSSKMIKEIALLKGDLSKFVPDLVEKAVESKLRG